MFWILIVLDGESNWTTSIVAILDGDCSDCSQPIVASVTAPSVAGVVISLLLFMPLRMILCLPIKKSGRKVRSLLLDLVVGKPVTKHRVMVFLMCLMAVLFFLYAVAWETRYCMQFVWLSYLDLRVLEDSTAPKVHHVLHNDEWKNANACSGKILVTIPKDHFGPILIENDPNRNRGGLVGDIWENRMECRQWGSHFSHVAGQSTHGAQFVALFGGYVDNEDHGEWFLYIGSGGKDLSGNKRTNKNQSLDQQFENMNEALGLSCQKGYLVRC